MFISHHAFRSYCPLFMKMHRLNRCFLSKLNSFDQNFMKRGHIVWYHNVFFKFDNGLYPTILSFGVENSTFLMVSGFLVQ